MSLSALILSLKIIKVIKKTTKIILILSYKYFKLLIRSINY
jgi:hypothetical protein